MKRVTPTLRTTYHAIVMPAAHAACMLELDESAFHCFVSDRPSREEIGRPMAPGSWCSACVRSGAKIAMKPLGWNLPKEPAAWPPSDRKDPPR